MHLARENLFKDYLPPSSRSLEVRRCNSRVMNTSQVPDTVLDDNSFNTHNHPTIKVGTIIVPF
jgi:hypothetical protein